MPNKGDPKVREFARRLLALEAGRNRPGGKKSTAFRVYDTLRGPLVSLMGTMGFRALVSRAITLAGVEIPALRSLQIDLDGSWEALGDELTTLSREGVLLTDEALVIHLLGLLLTFIGPALTVHVIKEAWPKAPFDGLDF